MVDIVSALIGFLVGVVASGIAVELGLKKLLSPPDRGKLTTVWSLSELPRPLVVTTGVDDDVKIPSKAKVVTNRQMPSGTNAEVRSNAQAAGNFAVDAEEDRAILFLGGVQKKALALWTVDDRLIARLRAEFNRLWTRSLDYVEDVDLADLPTRANATVRLHGRVEDVVPYQKGYLMRLRENGESVGVMIDENMRIVGRQVTVTGIVRPSSSGFTLLEALEVRPN